VWESEFQGEFGGWRRFSDRAEGGRGCGLAVLEAGGPGYLSRIVEFLDEVLHCDFSMHGGAGKMVVWGNGFGGKLIIYSGMGIFRWAVNAHRRGRQTGDETGLEGHQPGFNADEGRMNADGHR
jgi:hypothetical protein